ncbi:MAG: ankyrin repeat domain-containing protein [Lentisphaerae bacterium]|nr:ankyrin repeat domain-containing protein [Lentisphaerota bacterium]
MCIFLAGLILFPVFSEAGLIHDAVEAGDVQQVRDLLIANRQLVHSTIDNDVTPLHVAAGVNHTQIVELLLSAGADINAKTDKGYTPLHWAAFMNSSEAAAVLIRRGANTAARTNDGQTALQVAVQEKSSKVAQLLVRRTDSAYTDNILVSRLSDGKKAMASGDVARAYEIFSELLRNDPGNADVNFAYGMACVARSDFPRARMALQRVIQIDPTNDRARLELAMVYIQTGEHDAARAELLKVLSHKPPANVEYRIQEYLRNLDKGKTKWELSSKINSGYFYNDNINAGPYADVVAISPLFYGSDIIDSMAIDESSKPIGSFGQYGSVYLSAVRDLGLKDAWLASGDLVFYSNWLDANNEYETMLVQGAVSMRRTRTKSYLQIPVGVAHISTGHAPLLYVYSITPWLIVMSGSGGNLQYSTLCNLELRDYMDLNDRDGGYVSVAQTIKRYIGKERHSLSLDIGVFYTPARSGIYENSGKIWTIKGEYQIPKWRSKIYSSLRYMKTDYAEREMLATTKRSDIQNQITVGAAWDMLGWWGFDANYQYTANDSTFGLYQYDREIVTISTFFNF